MDILRMKNVRKQRQNKKITGYRTYEILIENITFFISGFPFFYENDIVDI